IAAHDPISFCGINSVGLKRRGFDNDQIARVQEVYRHLFMSDMNISQAIAYIEENMPASKERDMILSFVKSSPRGVIKGI
ncbi:MAG: acyl-[acyl-carrier-protein]--UDP-N-acetylglucosamine O-acyltransferase, partial [Paludibacteraceae bacterium]|nr:acyl-[acyl-carrier-protein]--UDP-N-acetylglucosamine O-acyltransferase [Paludibacteraceae bacterium]